MVVAGRAPASERTRTTGAAGPGRAGRLVGLDVARCLALLGMVATHVLPATDVDGMLTTTQWLAGGRASALFAVLLGVSVALVSGGSRPHAGGWLARDAAGLAVRAVLVAGIGLLLGLLDTGIAVILTYYGVVMLLALPFLALRARALLGLAVAWAVLSPLVSQAVRPQLPPRQFDSPAPEQLEEPVRLLGELLFTGYYPAFCWLAYVLLGMGLGRLDLRPVGTALRLAVVGLLVAVCATIASWVASAAVGFTGDDLAAVEGGMFGQTPLGEWRWLAVVAPHSTTPFDLLQTGGSAVLVIGACLLLVAGVGLAGEGAVRVVAVVFGAGTATLSLYALHVVMRTEQVWPTEEPGSFRWHLLVLLWAGAVLVAVGRRGPLEWAVGLLPRRIAGR